MKPIHHQISHCAHNNNCLCSRPTAALDIESQATDEMQTGQTGGAKIFDRPRQGQTPTFKRREPSVQDEFQVAKLALREHDSGEGLSFIVELFPSRRIARDEVFEDTACDCASQSTDLFFFVSRGTRRRMNVCKHTVRRIGHFRRKLRCVEEERPREPASLKGREIGG